MPIYDLKQDSIIPLPTATFADLGISERNDLQRILRDNVEVIAPDTLVIYEEFGSWEDSRRRIDLLAVDKQANLVVIELKRTEDGGHMELQALRYAAMISTMTFERTVEIYAEYLKKRESEIDAASSLMEFLGWDEPDEEQFAGDVRIVLASAEFSKELTTAVLWLCDRDIDIRCVRLRPYGTPDRIQLDVQQVIPLPEAEDYQIRVREKRHRERETRRNNRDYTKFNVTVDGTTHEKLAKRQAIRTLVRALVDAGHSPENMSAVVPKQTYFLINFDQQETHDDLERVMKSANHDMRCWFHDEKDIIHWKGQSYVFSNQWGKETEEAMQALVDHYQPENISFERYEA